MKIELANIYKYFETPETNVRREVLNDISLIINPGDSIAITGPSGSGKSTLLNIIGSLDKPSSGQVRYDDNDITKLGENQLASLRNKSIGFIFQLHHLLPQLNLLENVLLPLIPSNDKKNRKSNLDRVMSLLESIGLSDMITQRPGQLSVGECQRTAVVRALINDPVLLLADEPTGALDQDNADQLGELLSGINKDRNISIITVTHSDELARKMKINYRLEQGMLKGER